jgi:thiosulfate dehydrogenase [quinone] large subunit
MSYISDVYVWASLRVSIGLIFLWAFFDKVFGWGFSTTAEQAWIRGGSPTTGFLKFGTKGPFADFFQSLAGSAFIDWLFMIGLLGIGLGLLLGICVKIASWSGVVMLLLMWLAVLPPPHHPFIDEHVVYALVLMGVATTTVRSEDYFGLGKRWKALKAVRRNPAVE